jgi:hypothetical protein
MGDYDYTAIDLKSATDSTWDGEVFCDPVLVAEELALVGNEATVQPEGFSVAGTPAEAYLAARSGQAFELTICWD